jgi:hypothetical protein
MCIHAENKRKTKITVPAPGGQTAPFPRITRFSIPVHSVISIDSNCPFIGGTKRHRTRFKHGARDNDVTAGT